MQCAVQKNKQSAQTGDCAPGRKKNSRFRKEGKMTDICLHYERSLAVEPPRGWSYLQGTCIPSPSRGVCVLGERAKRRTRDAFWSWRESWVPHYAAVVI